ncbi:MipA/OmpV family protein [Sphingomonas sp.]|uniref:MipA/OmpV family protein n=1 Tax=Sphingomonas sp. TaxID=28214 RepID=UPI002CD6EBC6|nr:MipA/OmpV family protein [Sphingomonas sp.]HTG38048.1 MipA/OmpV family protein [Sphingomonas sp.]
MTYHQPRRAFAAGLSFVLAFFAAVPALAQDEEDRRPLRTRVGLGPQLVPSFPGSERVSLRPFIDVSRARGDDDFAFEAPDESAGFPLLRAERLSVGPSIGIEGRRRSDDVGGVLSEVGFTVEVGGFVQYQVSDAVRLRVEGRKGLGGHRGWIGMVGADYVMRDHDRWLVSIGPRVTLADNRYMDAYFGVTPDDAARSGLSAYDAGGGVQAVGATLGVLRQLSDRWGISGYAKYDRLAGDADDSPVVDSFGSRNQLSGGIALSYTFD